MQNIRRGEQLTQLGNRIGALKFRQRSKNGGHECHIFLNHPAPSHSDHSAPSPVFFFSFAMCFRVSCILSLICCLLVVILGPSFRIRLLLAYIVPISTADATHVSASLNHPRWGLHMIRPDKLTKLQSRPRLRLSCPSMPGPYLNSFFIWLSSPRHGRTWPRRNHSCSSTRNKTTRLMVSTSLIPLTKIIIHIILFPALLTK